MLRELEDERRKHEHDTAQGDDITYGLEKDRTRLREVCCVSIDVVTAKEGESMFIELKTKTVLEVHLHFIPLLSLSVVKAYKT